MSEITDLILYKKSVKLKAEKALSGRAVRRHIVREDFMFYT